MDFGWTKAETFLRQQVSGFLAAEMDQKVVRECELNMILGGLGPDTRGFVRKLGERRWVAPCWPEKYGGFSATNIERCIIKEEIAFNGGPWEFIGADIAGPIILQHGTDDNKNFLLPKIARGELEFSLGYTEPEAGSDIASVQGRAVKDGRTFVVNAQKVFSTYSHFAEYVWALLRTDSGQQRHRGLSLFAIDLRSPGITIRPLYAPNGERTNEVFFDDVKVPEENLIGEMNRGFYMVMEALDHERITPIGDIIRIYRRILDSVKTMNQNGKKLDPCITSGLSEISIKISIARLLSYRLAQMADDKIQFSFEPSMFKLVTSELWQQLANISIQVLGMQGLLEEGSEGAPFEGVFSRYYTGAMCKTIVGGTSEIMRNVIANRGLGLR